MKRRSHTRFVFEGLEGCIVSAVTLCTWPISRRWLIDWGSKPEERDGSWPGDQSVSPDHKTCTRAIDISASAADVWPWVVQFGLGRAGFYSYELLERIAGIAVTNLESIEPAMQSLDVGDQILLHPKAPGIKVADLEPGAHICFGVLDRSVTTEPDAGPGRSWSIYLDATAPNTCRLILRSCIELRESPSLFERFTGAVEEAVDFVMEQRMLRTLKRLAERG